jgi:hypothetical protein
MTELWKTWRCGTYEVSSLGNVRRMTTRGGKPLLPPRPIKPIATGEYLGFSPSLGPGVYLRQYVHRAVAEAFLGAIPDGFEVNHRDGNKLNNAASNLEYVTRAQNVQHAIATGLAPQMMKRPKPPKVRLPKTRNVGADHWMRRMPERIARGADAGAAKLTDSVVLSIRSMKATGIPQMDIAGIYSISTAQVSRIVTGKRWRHVG